MSEHRRQNFNIKGRNWPAMDEALEELLGQKKERNLTYEQIAQELNKRFPDAIGAKSLRSSDITSRRRDRWRDKHGF